MDEVFGAAAMVGVLLLCLGILHSQCQVHHKLFHNPINTIRVFSFVLLLSLGTFFFQVHQMYSGHLRYRLVPFEFPQREENSSFWLNGVINCLAAWILG